MDQTEESSEKQFHILDASAKEKYEGEWGFKQIVSFFRKLVSPRLGCGLVRQLFGNYSDNRVIYH